MKNQSVIKFPTDVIERAVLLQAFFNSVQYYQVLLNQRLEIIAFNDCAIDFHRNYTQLDLQKGKTILAYINVSLVADFKIQCEKALEGETVNYEHFINGEWFDFVITALYEEERIAGLSIVGHNTNNKKRAEKIIRQQSECLSTIAQFQSHQIRHPVSSILAIMNLIKEEEDVDTIRQYLQMLETATKQLDNVIRAIVNQSREI